MTPAKRKEAIELAKKQVSFYRLGGTSDCDASKEITLDLAFALLAEVEAREEAEEDEASRIEAVSNLQLQVLRLKHSRDSLAARLEKAKSALKGVIEHCPDKDCVPSGRNKCHIQEHHVAREALDELDEKRGEK